MDRITRVLPDPASTALAGPASTALAGRASSGLAGRASSGLAGRASTAPAGRASTALAGRDTHDPATTRKPIPTLVRNRRLRWLAALAITAVSALVVVRAVEGAALWDGLGELARRPELLALFSGGYAAAFALRAFASRTLLGRSGRDAGAGRLFTILHAALFANHALPVKAGEVLRPYLGARAGIPTTEAAVSTVVARVLDFAALLAIAAALLPLTAGSEGAAVLAIPALLLATAMGVLLWFRTTSLAWTRFEALDRMWTRARHSLRSLPPRAVLRAFALTVPGWLLESVVVYAAAQALGLGLTLHAAAAVTAFTILFQVVHLTPGGIGVYEASMTVALQAQGLAAGEALTLAVLTHGLNFVYSFALGAPLGVLAFTGLPSLGRIRASREDSKRARRFEIVAARLWNVLNEGKPFTPVFVAGTLVLLAVCLAVFRVFDAAAIALVLTLYLGFTVVLWGSVYYHLRIGTPWTNGLRFWRLVLENPDPTSGNFLEQVPKLLILVLLAGFLVDHPGAPAIAAVEVCTAAAAVLAVLSHQWWFTWAPPDPLAPTRLRNTGDGPLARRVILIVIDGCRADRFAEARTPFLDRLAAEGVACDDMQTVYPARTVTAFTSMLTGATPRVHGMRSNFVPSLGAKCESIFGVLEQRGMRGRLAGIAHLVDSFGERTVETVTAVTPNEEIDHALVVRAREILERDDPELLVLQTLSVDQTGHARGSYYPEYVERIEATDRLLEAFTGWCRDEGYLDGATVMVTSDHGQGRGIGGHGHLTEPERRVPFIAWGEGVPRGVRVEGPRSLLDVAPTLAYYLGAPPPPPPPPAQSVGQVLCTPEGVPARHEGRSRSSSRRTTRPRCSRTSSPAFRARTSATWSSSLSMMAQRTAPPRPPSGRAPTSSCGTRATAVLALRCGPAWKRRAGSTPAPPSTSTPTSSTTRRRSRRCSRRSRPARPTTCSVRGSSDTARVTRRGARRAIASSRWR